jgi:hypothetical protein
MLEGVFVDRTNQGRLGYLEAGMDEVPVVTGYDPLRDNEAALARTMAASVKQRIAVKRQVFFTFEVEEEGGFRRVPEIGLKNFPWASDFPGMDSPWPHSKEMGHRPAEAALGKEVLKQLVFDNAVSLYKIPVALPQAQALT